jgi:hypothetical protein
VVVHLPPVIAKVEMSLQFRAQAADLSPPDGADPAEITRRVASPCVAVRCQLLPAVAGIVELQGVQVDVAGP